MVRTSNSVLAASLLAIALTALPGAGAGQEPVPAVVSMDPEISWSPEAPAEGTLFRVQVLASAQTPIMGVHGSVAGEELHFRRLDARRFESFAAAPVGSEQLEAQVRVVYASGQEERFSRRIPVAAGTYEHETLRVAPRFGSPPSPEDQARLEEDRAMAREAARRAHRRTPLWSDAFVMPRNSVVTSEFGGGRLFNGQVSSRHMGLDLRGAHGDTVVAAARGEVVVVAPFLLAGNVVYLNHGAGILSAYFHLSEQLVAVGQVVEAGDPIGLVGATGRVTGPHLHWVVRYGNTSVDPRSLLTVVGVDPARAGGL